MKTLSGWKEIATYLNQSIRTVQRWEILGLPAHRRGKGKRAAVLAYPGELDAWGKAAPMRLLDEILELKSKIASLEAQVTSLKRELKSPKKVGRR